MKKTYAKNVIFICSISYVAIYMFIGAHGKYVSRIRTVGRDSAGNLVLVPKKVFEQWEPFPLFGDDTGRPKPIYLFYFPLVYLDRKIVHRDPW